MKFLMLFKAESEEMMELPPPDLAAQKTKTEMDNAETEKKDAQGALGDFFEALGQVEEIDAEIGLRRMNGLKDVYRVKLRFFYEKLKEYRDKITEYMGNEDLRNFSIAVRSMKCMLEEVGATGLSNMAFKLETASRNNDAEYCARRFPKFIIGLFTLHEQLSVVFPPEETFTEKSEKEKNCPPRLRENIEKAVEAADRYDNDTGIEILKELTAYDFGEEAESLLKKALRAFKKYNNDDAKAFLLKISF